MNCKIDGLGGNDVLHCHICGKELDMLSATISESPLDAIYICFGALKQRIFVYGKYIETKFGAIVFNGQYTREECEKKVCETDISAFLHGRGETEYSRLVDCHRGAMRCILLTREMIEKRKNALSDGFLSGIFHDYSVNKKHFCGTDAQNLNYRCTCGEELIALNSDRYRELMGIDDIDFIKSYLPGLLELR